MEYEEIKYILDSNKTVSLLRADNAPLIISFIYFHFKKNNQITIPNSELVSSLSDYLYALRERHGDNIHPDSPQDYLDRWASQGFLRKYYQINSDDPIFELTPAAERTLDWIRDLNKKEFIGTESRLLLIFESLRQLAYRSSDDPQIRLAELEKQKEQIENDIKDIIDGKVQTLTRTQIRERFATAVEMAHKLLSDFRQIEENFRELDRSVRKQQASTTLRKGEILENVFKAQDHIWDTDQGRSFRAFWELIMSQQKQDELIDLIETVCKLPSLMNQSEDEFLRRLRFALAEEAGKVNRTNHVLVEQLRKFVDDQLNMENKRIIELTRQIKALAIQLRDSPPTEKDFFEIETRPSVDLIMDRPLWDIPKNLKVSLDKFEEGDESIVGSRCLEDLYSQHYVDPEELLTRIRTLLMAHSQVTLKQISDAYPIEKGLSEILAYLDLASKDDRAYINETAVEILSITNKETGKQFTVETPQVIYTT